MEEDVDRRFRMFCDSLKWFGENYDRLRVEYDGKWVVIRDSRVVASYRNCERMMNALKKRDFRDAIVEYVQAEPVNLIF